MSSVDGTSLHGIGKIEKSMPDDNSIIFKERGFWNVDRGPQVSFRNAYKWIVSENTLGLGRYGYEMSNPIHLVNFEIIDGQEWLNISPYLCGSDTYHAALRWSDETLQLFWVVRGPKKDQTVEYLYS